MNTTSHSGIGLFLLGMCAAFVVSGIGLFFLYATPWGNVFLRTYVIQQPEWPDVDAVEEGITFKGPTATPVSAGQEVKILVPKAYASEAYYAEINAVVRSFNAFGSSYTQLAPLLDAINQKSLANDYRGFFDLIFEAKTLIRAQEAALTAMAGHVASLGVANQSTPDAVTKSLTADFIAASNASNTTLVAYVRALDQLLSGSIPTAQQLLDLQEQGRAAKAAVDSFMAALQPLLDRFEQ
jgi:hypothetical protein